MRFRVIGLLAALTAGSAAHPAGAAACSMGRVAMFRPPVFLLATALPDTVAAGPGSVEHFPQTRQPLDPRPFYGQRVRAEDVGGDVPDAVARAVRSGSGDVVLVPWEHREDCRTTRWSSSARWVPPGTRGVFAATPRDPAQWVDGRPTFDVYNAWDDPYPHASSRYGEVVSADSVLTADELFSLWRALPTWQQAEAADDPYPLFAPLFRWAAAHPTLARRHPARGALIGASEEVQPCVAEPSPAEIPGTWLLAVEAEGEPQRMLYVRTSARRFSPECPDSMRTGDPGRYSPRRANRYTLYLHGATEEDSIPQENAEAQRRGGCDVGTLELWDSSGRLATGSAVEARLDLEMLARCFPSSAALRRAAQAEQDAVGRGEDPRKGHFQSSLSAGLVTFHQTLEENGRTLLKVQGVRASRRVLAY